MRRRLKSGTKLPIAIPAKGVDDPFDMRKTKRVNFIESEADDVPDNASPRGQRATRSPRSDEPKTSEYAYFKKLKSDAVSSHSRSLRNESIQLKSSKIGDLGRETISTSDTHKPRTDSFSVSGEREGPSNSRLFFSPDVSKHKPYSLRCKDLTNKTEKGPLLLSEDVTPAGPSLHSSPLNVASGNSETARSPGDHDNEKGIFSAKRHRLRQLAAQTLFPEVDKLHPKGSDLVSSLLSRLYPKGKENDDSSKADINNNSGSPTFHELNDLEKELHFSHTRHWDKDLPKICSGRSSDILRFEWDTFSSEFPFPNYGIKTHFRGECTDLGEPSMSSITQSFCKQHAFSFHLPFEGYRSMGYCHLKELDDSPNDHPIQGPDRLLLEWDFKSGQDIVDSSIINHESARNLCPRSSSSWEWDFKIGQDTVHSSISNYETAKNMCPRLSTSWEWDFERGQATADSSIINQEAAMNSGSGLATAWNADFPQLMYDFVDANELCSLHSSYFQNFDSVPRDRSTSYLTRDSRPSVEDLNFAVAGHDLSSLALPRPPTCITPAEHRNKEQFLYYRDQYWLDNKFRDAKPQIECWQKSLPVANFPYEDPQSIFHAWQIPNDVNRVYSSSRLEEAAEEPFTALSEGAFNDHFLSSNIEGSFDTYRPLLLDDARQFKPKQGLYFHDDNEFEYGFIFSYLAVMLLYYRCFISVKICLHFISLLFLVG